MSTLERHPRRLRTHPTVRLAFVGQETYFEGCALEGDTDELTTRFIDFRAGADAEQLLARLDQFDPDVVWVFRPEIIPAGLFAGLSAITVGYLTEPVPRDVGDTHPDLERRFADLRMIDPANFDRIASFDPLIRGAAESTGAKVWRSFPLPVADRYYAPVTAPRQEPRALFVGRSTEHREEFLIGAKHLFDVVHIAHGVWGERLIELLAETEIGINVHNEPYPSFENRVCTYLAAGKLVVTEPLSPTHGLEPGIDYLECDRPSDLIELLGVARTYPAAFQRVRLRGRAKAEAFRASRVYPVVLDDLFHDLRAFGRRWNVG